MINLCSDARDAHDLSSHAVGEDEHDISDDLSADALGQDEHHVSVDTVGAYE